MDSPIEAPCIYIEPPEEDNQRLTNEQDFSSSYPAQSIPNSHYFDGTAFNTEDDLFDFSYNCDYSIGPLTRAMLIST